ncbi:Transcriptional regulator, MarR family [Roseomonas mucosa]|uniref:Salmolysin n=1 Tax=Roseomonas mucosa TaxID=207340 RepID=A0A1S8D695_9PROT|nr:MULTISPECIES: MarR family transcriptional regulator [Roseomonas]MBS5904298.1 MarR family transcriptional regulator [Acetobacteraceae bacterium]MDT8261924.1 MarR family transcriptional regulator [Roseomonas sp. DSM 102946]ATR20783.1 MarR family transcriptional regulator [Roseomonas sp. FDAARGOS_362]AWV22687.1 Transcriptional regulator, MarR family [Roseomonas mucosa]MCG7353825.1 MarR family transcriptional regulator [Roseomonas mucosa]
MDPANAPATNRDFSYRLLLLARRWRALIDTRLQQEGLTDAVWRPLVHLANLGDGVHQKDLATSLGIERPSLVRLLDALERDGFVERNADQNDRRARCLRLTPAGQAIVAQVRPRIQEMEQELLAGLPEDELQLCTKVLEQLDRRIATIRPG